MIKFLYIVDLFKSASKQDLHNCIWFIHLKSLFKFIIVLPFLFHISHLLKLLVEKNCLIIFSTFLLQHLAVIYIVSLSFLFPINSITARDVIKHRVNQWCGYSIGGTMYALMHLTRRNTFVQLGKTEQLVQVFKPDSSISFSINLSPNV